MHVQECFVGAHIAMFVTGLVLLLLLVVVLPLVLYRAAKVFVKNQEVTVVRRKFVQNVIDEFKPEFWWLGIAMLVFVCF